MTDRERLAGLFHKRTAVTREKIFGAWDATLRPLGDGGQIHLALPGMVSENYRSGGLVIVSISPAGGQVDLCHTPGDERLRRAIEALRSTADLEAFEEVNRAYQADMPDRETQWRHIDDILNAARQNRGQLAFAYLIPFGIRNDGAGKLSNLVIEQAYQSGFVDILRELEPSLVVPVDRYSEAATRRAKLETGMPFIVIPYTGKRDAQSERDEALAAIARHSFGSSECSKRIDRSNNASAELKDIEIDRRAGHAMSRRR
ncbi:hypothetical protein WBP07_22515 (plasmid) [Novosphingobium sp. BL-8A]|uniref:hypothetical protein n=1 Tax=Novosphingobium sp. BL-8A TaxID=3127639 RepID=UPI0037583668